MQNKEIKNKPQTSWNSFLSLYHHEVWIYNCSWISILLNITNYNFLLKSIRNHPSIISNLLTTPANYIPSFICTKKLAKLDFWAELSKELSQAWMAIFNTQLLAKGQWPTIMWPANISFQSLQQLRTHTIANQYHASVVPATQWK